VPKTEDEYHLRRAREERDLGRRAEGQEAASAHLRLAALHMDRARGGATPLSTSEFGGAGSVHHRMAIAG